ncbi:hypothetical protein VNO80_06256 [Phaseolus coccineus]|uniref:Uncharacterized protein n=1 Tax=Phaseolus coccineus TaxID=3886 RepID=A0AAN9NHE5_PHACN
MRLRQQEKRLGSKEAYSRRVDLGLLGCVVLCVLRLCGLPLESKTPKLNGGFGFLWIDGPPLLGPTPLYSSSMQAQLSTCILQSHAKSAFFL